MYICTASSPARAPVFFTSIETVRLPLRPTLERLRVRLETSNDV
jgi:hypothetical protein